MNPRQFFEKVAFMREKQKEYYRTRDKEILKQSIALEQEIDAEIARVRSILAFQEAMEANAAGKEKPPDEAPRPPEGEESELPFRGLGPTLNPEPDCRHFKSPDRCIRRVHAYGMHCVIPPCRLSYGKNPTCSKCSPKEIPKAI